MRAVAAVNCSLWLICGTVDNDMLIRTPSVIGVTLSATQVILYVMYNPKRKRPTTERHVGNCNNDLSAANDSTRSKGLRILLLISPRDELSSSLPFVKIAADQYRSLVCKRMHSSILLAPPTSTTL